MSISIIKVSNVDSTDVDMDSSVKFAKVTFIIFLDIRETKTCFVLSW